MSSALCDTLLDAPDAWNTEARCVAWLATNRRKEVSCIQRELHKVTQQMTRPLTEIGVKRHTVTSSVADAIRERIIGGDFPGGHQLRQEAIAAELGVSRIPVREALVQLESEGLVVIHTHRGAVVAELTIEDALDIFDSRLLLEPFILRRAIENASDADIRDVKAASLDYERGLKNGATPSELGRLNWAFHIAMSKPAARPRTLAVLQSLYSSADRYLALQIDQKFARRRAMKGHAALAEAYAQRDAATGAKLLKDHIAEAKEDVIAGLKQRSNGVHEK
jgi:DNA-binding GntR family transcriptional regulator